MPCFFDLCMRGLISLRWPSHCCLRRCAKVRRLIHRQSAFRMRALLKKGAVRTEAVRSQRSCARDDSECFSALADGRKFELVSMTAPEALPILGDRIQLQQVILNLVMNGIDAMKDTPTEDRVITIRASRVENFAQLSVSDRGSGIPKEKVTAGLRTVFHQ